MNVKTVIKILEVILEFLSSPVLRGISRHSKALLVSDIRLIHLPCQSVTQSLAEKNICLRVSPVEEPHIFVLKRLIISFLLY